MECHNAASPMNKKFDRINKIILRLPLLILFGYCSSSCHSHINPCLVSRSQPLFLLLLWWDFAALRIPLLSLRPMLIVSTVSEALFVVALVFAAAAAASTLIFFRCDPTCARPLRCRKGACSVAKANSCMSITTCFWLLSPPPPPSSSSQTTTMIVGLAKINVLCKSGMDRTKDCIILQSIISSKISNQHKIHNQKQNHNKKQHFIFDFRISSFFLSLQESSLDLLMYVPSGTTWTQKSECTFPGSSAYNTSSQPNWKPE